MLMKKKLFRRLGERKSYLGFAWKKVLSRRRMQDSLSSHVLCAYGIEGLHEALKTNTMAK